MALLAASLAAQGFAADRLTGPPVFSDVTEGSGVDFLNSSSGTSQKYLLESMVGGVAALDYDRDGLLDLYFVNGAALRDPMPDGASPDKSSPAYWNRLYRNEGDWRFTDVTELAGVQGTHFGQGVAAGDFDNDGWPDLFLANFGANSLYRNRGDGTFEDVSGAAGVVGGGWSAGAAFLDIDRDGHLDLFVTRYVEWSFAENPWCGERKPGYRSYCHPKHFGPISHLVYRNRGDGTFEDVTQASGVGGSPGKGLGIAFADLDGDGWSDVLVANDSFPQQLFRNLEGTGFEEIALLSGVAYDENGRTFAGMGADLGDFDNDGDPDVFINALAHQRYALFRNDGELFEYVSGPVGVSAISASHSGWGAKFFDYDNDGLKDIFVAQGHVMDNIELTQPDVSYLEPLVMMRNSGGRFTDVSSQLGEGFAVPRAARGAAIADFDNDGFLDIAVNCRDQRAVLLKNEGNDNRWITLFLRGTRSNLDGYGARVRIVGSSGLEQHETVSAAGSYLSSGDPRAHFGLGSGGRLSLVEIRWPSGTVQSLLDVEPNQILLVTEPGE
ncbi:MAG: CRTAC1 family protein [Bryobacterales bacterium]|nr:CRTAC1 family protein [Bryobacterales bacterium]